VYNIFVSYSGNGCSELNSSCLYNAASPIVSPLIRLTQTCVVGCISEQWHRWLESNRMSAVSSLTQPTGVSVQQTRLLWALAERHLSLWPYGKVSIQLCHTYVGTFQSTWGLLRLNDMLHELLCIPLRLTLSPWCMWSYFKTMYFIVFNSYKVPFILQ
jgi:hypothetical protein